MRHAKESDEPTGVLRRRTVLVLVLLLAVLAPRLAVLHLTQEEIWGRGDLNWDQMARNLLAGDGLLIAGVGPMRVPMYAHKTPAYALLLAGVYGTVGRTPSAVGALQILIALFATWATYRAGTRLTGSRGAGYLAALLTAVYPPFVVQDVQIMETALYRGLVALLTAQLILLARRPGTERAVWAGAVAGLAVLTRTTILFFLPLAGAWLIFTWSATWRRRALLALAGSMAFLAVLSPWLVRNAALFGRLHLVTGGGRSFWIGSSESFVRMFPVRSVDDAERAEWFGLPEAERRRLASLDEISLDRALYTRARRDLRRHPSRIGRLAVVKTIAAFSPRHNPREAKDPLDRQLRSLKDASYSLSYGPLLVAGTVGLLLLLGRRPRPALLLLLHLLAFEVFTLLFWAHSRHRFFLDAFLACTTAYLLLRLHRRISTRRGPLTAPPT
jgi:hypothetical protein